MRASSSGQEAWFEWERAGIRAHEVDPGTGYHVPEGFLAVHRSDAMGRDTRRSILASEGKALLLGLAGMEAGGPESSRTAPVIEPEPARA
jgi:hypothetical protein